MTSAVSKKIKAAIFDVDGMLLDTRNLLFRAYAHTLTAHGYPRPSNEEIAAHVGMEVKQSYAELAPGSDIDLIHATHREFHDNNLDLIADYNGLINMLSQLKKAKLKLGVFTSRGPSTPKVLANAKIDKFFEVVITAADVAHHKPHPEGLLKALESLNAEPKKAAMLGDSVYDVEAGKNAGVALTIGITHGFGTRESLEDAKPDFIVDSLAEIPPILLGRIS
ncbi:hypothetical protein A3F65_00805 [Candidatus Saccharibacteria bacterium RIFCSPHIGHO2_12_FULL_47_16b]|nr:MAG: hypothetical protein A3F65_00805 [Candidatus Saccharibacteria bacterium RIFCSPHIGHO2_12_FULL_47_16b]